MPDKLFVTISSPDRIEWEGEADGLSSENSQGPFDILPGHTNFVTIIEKKPITIHRIDGKREYSYSAAVIYVKDNTVTVYVSI